MILETLSEKKPAVLGLAQSASGLVYIALIATFFRFLEQTDVQPPEFLAALIMLSLLVLSATIMGLVYLGMPIYFAMKGNWAKALRTLGFTLLFSTLAIVILLVSIFLV